MPPQVSFWPLLMILTGLGSLVMCVVYQGADSMLPCWYYAHERRCLPFINKHRFALLGSQDKDDVEPGSELGQPLMGKRAN